MARTPHTLLHLVEADHPGMPPPEGGPRLDFLERGGDLSALACAAMLDAEDSRASDTAHAVVALGPAAVQRRAAALGAGPIARVPVPFGTPHATANVLRKVVRRGGVRFDACVAWSAFAARVARLTGFGPGRGDLAPLLEADPHRLDPDAINPTTTDLPPGSLGPLTERVMRAAGSPARLPMGGDWTPAGGAMRVALLADPAASGSATLAWRGSALAAAASGPLELVLPTGCASARRVSRLPEAGQTSVSLDSGPLPQRLARAHVALACYGRAEHEHASPGLVAYALSMGVAVVAERSRIDGGHPSLPGGDAIAGLYEVHAAVPIEVARAILAAREAVAPASA
ncbi:MAG: hypothetical protein ACIAS6_08605 [Phycisphaerales bacterium JB060]